jgi:hypothetical protein
LVAWAALWHWWCQECKPLCFAVSPLEPHPIAAFESFLADTRYNGDNRPRFLYPRSVVERPCSSFLIVVEFQGHDPAAMLVCQSCLVMATCQSTCQPRFQDHAVETIIIRQQFPAETKDEQYTARSYSSCSIGRCSPAVPDRAVVKRSWSTGAPWARIRGHDATMRTAYLSTSRVPNRSHRQRMRGTFTSNSLFIFLRLCDRNDDSQKGPRLDKSRPSGEFMMIRVPRRLRLAASSVSLLQGHHEFGGSSPGRWLRCGATWTCRLRENERRWAEGIRCSTSSNA